MYILQFEIGNSFLPPGLRQIQNGNDLNAILGYVPPTAPPSSNTDQFITSEDLALEEFDSNQYKEDALRFHNLAADPTNGLSLEERDFYRENAILMSTIAGEMELKNQGYSDESINTEMLDREGYVGFSRLSTDVLQSSLLSDIFKNINLPKNVPDTNRTDLLTGLEIPNLPPTTDDLTFMLFHAMNPRNGFLTGSTFGNLGNPNGFGSGNAIMGILDGFNGQIAQNRQASFGVPFFNETMGMMDGFQNQLQANQQASFGVPFVNETMSMLDGFESQLYANQQAISNVSYNNDIMTIMGGYENQLYANQQAMSQIPIRNETMDFLDQAMHDFHYTSYAATNSQNYRDPTISEIINGSITQAANNIFYK